uniref:Major facilitator superfamily associated domain-containing protein n=4 Tax=Photinus pyralis TaxID=7054 RepID=A0A1Y1LW25_PHOPY
MQGPSYALIYTTIVAYANAISPPGMSATMQGIAAGMDDGFGYAVGSVLGGILYKYIGGTSTLRVFSGLSIVCGISYLIIHKTILRNTEDPTAVKVQTYHAPGNNEDLVA